VLLDEGQVFSGCFLIGESMRLWSLDELGRLDEEGTCYFAFNLSMFK